MNREEQLEQQQHSANERQLQALADDRDFTQVMATAEGRRFTRRILGECAVYHSSFSTDALLMAHKEGRRSIGLWLTGLFEQHPETYIQLLKEKDDDRPST